MVPPSPNPCVRCDGTMASFGARGSAETPSARGAEAATDAEYGIRRAAEEVMVMAVRSFGSSVGRFIVRPVSGTAGRRDGFR